MAFLKVEHVNSVNHRKQGVLHHRESPNSFEILDADSKETRIFQVKSSGNRAYVDVIIVEGLEFSPESISTKFVEETARFALNFFLDLHLIKEKYFHFKKLKVEFLEHDDYVGQITLSDEHISVSVDRKRMAAGVIVGDGVFRAFRKWLNQASININGDRFSLNQNFWLTGEIIRDNLPEYSLGTAVNDSMGHSRDFSFSLTESDKIKLSEYRPLPSPINKLRSSSLSSLIELQEKLHGMHPHDKGIVPSKTNEAKSPFDTESLQLLDSCVAAAIEIHRSPVFPPQIADTLKNLLYIFEKFLVRLALIGLAGATLFGALEMAVESLRAFLRSLGVL
ncbi:MAG: hypothetical protein H6907_07600 [Hyphomicrobiales bacterium]|nr:hypothetical protein [Hyphomicrobiales bacterium]